MYLFLEILQRAYSLDIAWFWGLILDNLFWVFAIIALMYFFKDDKKPFLAASIFFIDFFAFSFLATTSNIVFLSAEYLALFYITKLCLLKLAEESKVLKNWLIPISALHGFALVLIYNIFWV